MRHALSARHSPLEKTPHKAGVVGVALFGAEAALLPVASERCGAAGFDGVHQAELMEGEAMSCAVPGAVGAEDVGHLEGGPGHGYWPGALWEAALPRGGFARSSGLTMAETVCGVTAV